MSIGLLDFYPDDIAHFQGIGDIAEKNIAVDLRRIGLGSPRCTDIAVFVGFTNFVDNHRQAAADLSGKFSHADGLGPGHQPRIALFLDRLGNCPRQVIGRCTSYGLKAEGADAVELGFIQPVEQV